MMRVYQSVIAAVVNCIVFVQNFIAAKKKRLGLLFSGGVAVDRRVAKALCLVLVVLLVATVSLSARQTIAGLARKSQVRVASWTSSESNPTKLIRSLADRYGRYGSWRSAHGTGEGSNTGKEVSLPANNAGPMPVVPMSPMPPEAPPTFTNNPLEAGVTIVQALHITELRDAINLVRARVGLAAASWEAGAASGQPIKATHILEMRTKLDDVRFALGMSAVSYTPPAPGVGVPIRAAHVQELRNAVIAMFNTTANASGAVARLDPANQTGGGGENPLSRNYNWSIPLVGLAGRNGLDLGLSLSYNSLVWTKRGTSSISFDDDGGFPSPGFRLGFPVIQPLYFNSEVNKSAFLLITPDGGHVELRQVGTSNLYEAADSSHLLFNSATLMLRTTDGTQLTYALKGSAYECTEIKDRNGNFITINYTSFNRIDTVVDTLARTIKFNYDGSNTLSSITQTWTVNGQAQTHTWATFAYNPNHTIQTNFAGLTVLGPPNGSTIKVLTQVTLDDNSAFSFDTTVWGQIWKINNYAADGHLLNYRAYNLPGDTPPHTDCPRFTERHDWAENANRGGSVGASGLPAGPEQEVLTAAYAVPTPMSWTLPDGITNETGMVAQVTAPNGTSNKIYFAGTAGTANGWRRSLPSMVETYGKTTPGGAVIKQRSSVTKWIQDNQNVSYILNPRVEERNVYDFDANGQAQNHGRTRISYQAPLSIGDGTSCILPEDVFEYQANASTVLRRTRTEYTPLNSEYANRRIIGLVSEKRLYEVDPNTAAETLMSKVSFAYDQAGSIQGADAPVQHDNTNYTASFVTGRANVSSVTRHNVVVSQSTTTTIRYNTAGAPVASIDPLGKQTSLSYADSFSDGNNGRNTLAYPTTVTDPDNFSSTTQYNFDYGLVTRTQGPPPAGQTTGEIKRFIYENSLARIQKVAIEFNGNTDYSHVRFEYPASQTRVDTYSTIQEGVGEKHSFKISDGFGRTIASASNHPGSSGGFSGKLVLYNNVGQAIKTSNPTETGASGTPSQWTAAGDDASGWLYTQQTYDWKGRPLVTTNPDGTTKEASYNGCGCAGGEVVTLTDEGTIDGGAPKRRQQKIYSDILGRTIKTEVLNWQGGSVYSATVTSYNARDQVTLGRQYKGPEGSTTYQDTTMTYDGYGRLATKHVPQQAAGAATAYNYNPDDTLSSVVDGRGATCTYNEYNGRNQVKNLTHTLSGSSSINISFAYDGAGNRISMAHTIDGVAQDSATYVYDQLSRLTSETRHINALEGSATQGNYTIGYSYTLSGELESVTDPFNSTTNYGYDAAGRTSSVTGSYGSTNYNYATGMQYRAWGAVKAASFGNGTSASVPLYNARLKPVQFRLMVGQFNQMRDDYSYFADGRLRQLTDLDDHVGDPRIDTNWHYMSRAYSYDHVGRVTGVGQAAGAVRPPFSASYGYDEFDNMTSRSGQYGIQPSGSGDSAPYVNNRRVQTGWTYDADGHILTSADVNSNSTRTWSYDAAGRNIRVTETSGTVTTINNNSYDGDGKLIFESVSNSTTVSNYLIRSTVQNGAVLTKLDASGNKSITYVAAGALVLPMQTKDFNGNPTVTWIHRDASGLQEGSGAYDPLGNLIFNQTPVPGGPPPGVTGIYGPSYGGSSWGSFSNANNFSSGCRLDGAPADCNSVNRMMQSGTAVQCPNNQCTQWNPNANGGQGGFEFFRAYADGYAGYSPLNSVYDGRGTWYVPQGGTTTNTRSDDVMSRPRRVRPEDGNYGMFLIQSFFQRIFDEDDPQNPAVDVSKVDKLLQNPTCKDFLNRVLREIDYNAPSLLAMDGDYFADYFHGLDSGGAFHNGRLRRGTFGESGGPRDITIDVSQARRGTKYAVEYTAIHEAFHPVNGSFFQSTHFEMATAAYNAGKSLGLFKRLKNIAPDSRGSEAADIRNSRRFDRMLFAACPPRK